MKEKLYTIPLNDAVMADDECPFCFIERKLEQDLMDFVLGNSASYMEADVRDMTDRAGFCRDHSRKMFEYGNTLGNAWILKTHLMRLNKEMKQEMKHYFGHAGSGLFKSRTASGKNNSLSTWIQSKQDSCYICNQFQEMYQRSMDSFLNLYVKDSEFREKILASKGFCLYHFSDLCEYAQSHLSDRERSGFFPPLFDLMSKNMDRIFEDVSWLVEKFDYRNADADWKNSRDAIQRAMQKLKGGYPADPPYKMKK